jgi:hypothetical protein
LKSLFDNLKNRKIREKSFPLRLHFFEITMKVLSFLMTFSSIIAQNQREWAHQRVGRADLVIRVNALRFAQVEDIISSLLLLNQSALVCELELNKDSPTISNEEEDDGLHRYRDGLDKAAIRLAALSGLPVVKEVKDNSLWRLKLLPRQHYKVRDEYTW